MKTINVHGREYTIHYATGKVEESGKNMETRISGGGGGGFTYQGTGGTSPVSIQSRTVVHDQIFLTDKNGNEHAFQLQDFDVACREGNEISILWAIKKGKPTGKYIVVLNHSTRQDFYHDKALKNVFRFNIWYFLGGGAVIGFILGRDVGSAILCAALSIIAWALVWDFGALKRFKAEAANYIVD